MVWLPGVTGWDYLEPICTSAGLRLWCDETNVWRLDKPFEVYTPGLVVLAATQNVTRADDTIDRDSDTWYDAVQVTYTSTNVTTGATVIEYDSVGASSPTKVLVVKYDRPKPRDGAAQAFMGKIDGQGVVGQVIATTPTKATAMLITDASHAIPVQVLRSGLRTIAYGTGRIDALSLPNIPLSGDVRVGDQLVTSGLGGTFPAGFPVGVITALNPDETRLFVVADARPEAALDRSSDRGADRSQAAGEQRLVGDGSGGRCERDAR